MRNIDIKQRDLRRRKGKWHIYLPALIISFFGIFFYLFITDRSLTQNALKYVFTLKRTEIVYETFDIYIDTLVEEGFRDKVVEDLLEVKFDEKNRFNFVEDKDDADVVLEYGVGEYELFSDFLLPVGHMYWIEDSISSTDLEGGKYKAYASASTYADYQGFLSSYYPDINIKVDEEMVESLKTSEGEYIGFVKPDELNEKFKLLKVDDCYFLDTFDCGLAVSVAIQSQESNLPFIANIIQKNVDIQLSNFNNESVAKVNMTGVTAITRRLGQVMEQKQDFDYPAERIGGFLSDADLTHTSNEISFVEGCTSYSGMRFCSRPEYIETLLASGIDVVELTGNHNNDYGSKYNTNTINDYIDNGLGYFGGGLDSEDAAKPYITEIDGNKIAFLGYNYYDTMLNTGAIATSSHAGSNSYSDSKVKEDIEAIRDEVDIIIVTFQFQECYSYPSSDVIYPICYKPISNQKETFRKAVSHGADIVVGTQAHQPQTYEFYEDGVIFYGLGNLYFDQTPWIGTRQGMVLTHYFKGGELIQTKITATMYDSALQVDIANEDDADLLLELLNTARKSL